MSTTATPPASTSERHSTETGLDVVTGAFSYSGRAISGAPPAQATGSDHDRPSSARLTGRNDRDPPA